jgi:hypothetical protein
MYFKLKKSGIIILLNKLIYLYFVLIYDYDLPYRVCT